MYLSKFPIRFLVLSALASWAVLIYLLLSGFAVRPAERFEEITAERLNIVNEDGTTVIAIANKQRIAPPVFDGKEYPIEVAEGREYMSGMIFFNEAGDEMGGLIFNSFELPNGRSAGIGHLSFDRFKDNQVLSLEYNENRSGVRSGITIYDRPGDGTFVESLDLLAEAHTGNPSKERMQEIRDSLTYLSQGGHLGKDRLFIGSKNEVPQLTMNDQAGKQRVKLFVDEHDEARLVFYDSHGEVVGQFPEK